MTPDEKRASIQALRERVGQIMVAKTPRKGFTKKQREGVWEACEGCCIGCEDRLQPGWHIDHIKALADGGEHAPRNWVALCPSCHIQKTRAEATARAKTERIRDREINGPRPAQIHSRNEWPAGRKMEARPFPKRRTA